MLEGMYSAAAGMYAQQARLDSLSNDIANVNTAGYKPVRQGFRDLLYDTGAAHAVDADVQLGTGSEITDLGRVTRQGAFQSTGNPLDVAVSGPGFFQVRQADGTRVLTRAGSLQVDNQGRMSTITGELLEPAITLPANADPSKVSINPQGLVAYEGRELGQIRLVNVTAPSELRPAGENTFEVTPESGAPRAAGNETTLQQGVLEGSAVELGEVMTTMIESQRAYELASKAISTQDKIAEIALGVKR
ncbi:MAG: flagellar hook-basal body protein [Solirubrobacteraceae bacterium]|nr:flagellar hook-basal body protein [Solirubrobacteraceae bacterium]